MPANCTKTPENHGGEVFQLEHSFSDLWMILKAAKTILQGMRRLPANEALALTVHSCSVGLARDKDCLHSGHQVPQYQPQSQR